MTLTATGWWHRRRVLSCNPVYLDWAGWALLTSLYLYFLAVVRNHVFSCFSGSGGVHLSLG